MSALPRLAQQVIEPQSVLEGAGVRLHRSIGTQTLDYLDPFLLFDDFTSKHRHDYEAGFPLHPHRGIETVTYVLEGEVQHKDTLGNAGSIGAGEVQWMTAGRGIMHEEMPQVRPEGIMGFQLWVNLPARLKMTRPRYQGIRSDQIPEIRQKDGARVRVITGTVDGITGPVTGIAADPTYLDVFIPSNIRLCVCRCGSISTSQQKPTVDLASAPRHLRGRRFCDRENRSPFSSVSLGVWETAGRADRSVWSLCHEY